MSTGDTRNFPGILESLDIAIRMMSSNRHWKVRRAMMRLQRERDMRHAINQRWAKRRREKQAQTTEGVQGRE